MASLPEPVAKLIEVLGKLPGVGPRSAERLALHLVQTNIADVKQLAESLVTARERIHTCKICGSLTEPEPCAICVDDRRDGSLICVIERAVDIISLEKSGTFRGRYHVLHGALSPLDGIGPQDLKIAELLKRIQADDVREVIISTDPTLAGETTATYLAEKIHPLGAKVTRIGYGVPMGGDIEYTDELTLTRALEGRREI